MVIIHNLDTEKTTVVATPEQTRSKTDKSGVATAIQMKELITLGKTIYEYSPQLLRLFNTFGKKWKTHLRSAWETGAYHHAIKKEDIPYLQRLRNKLGGSL